MAKQSKRSSAEIDQLIAVMIQNVVDHATTIESLAQQAADEAESAQISSEEQLAVNEEISTSAQLFAELAEKLQKNMNLFTV